MSSTSYNTTSCHKYRIRFHPRHTAIPPMLRLHAMIIMAA